MIIHISKKSLLGLGNLDKVGHTVRRSGQGQRRDLTMFRSLMLFALTLALPAFAAPVAIGDAAPEITFKDIRYLPRTLKDFGARKAVLLLFHTQEDVEALKQLDALAQSATPEVAVAGVDVTPNTSIIQIAAKALELDGDYLVLKDFDAQAASALGVAQTPAAIVLDGEHKLRFRGPLAQAENAVKALLEGTAIATPDVAVKGKAIAPETLSVSGELTYAKDVAPILQKHCDACHQPGEAAPFSLRTFKQVSSRGDMIAEVVREERMPPWYAAPDHGLFMNDRRMSTKEKDTILAWVKGGMKKGDLDDAPEAEEKPASPWRIGEPDLILTAAEEDSIPATGYVDYKYIQLPYAFEEDTWVQGIEILPSNLSVVHHVNLAYNIPGSAYEEQNNFLTGRVPGNPPVDIPGPVAMLIPKNSVLFLQIHYVTTGKEQKNRMQVGLRYAEDNILKRVYYRRLRPETIEIPPGIARHPMESSWTFDRNAIALALFAHMHVRGRDISYFATFPDGKQETLLVLPNYNFDWQLAYQYIPGTKFFPKGTELRTVSHYDNSAFNPYNPDPSATVPYGDQTIHEMNDAYVFFIDEDEFLNITVDGKTGRAIKEESLAKAE